MEALACTSLPQPLASFARKTASGGKIRVRRFAPAWRADKPLYRFGKTRRRAQTRVGACILANTIGNLVADGVSSGGKAKADDTYATHTVTDGQTAWGLSQAGGYTLDQLQAVNQGVDLANLDIGQTLNLPFMASDISRQTGAAFAAPVSDQEQQVANDAVAAMGLDWGTNGGPTQTEIQRAVIDRQRMESLDKSWLGQTDQFQKVYSDFRAGLAAYDTYGTSATQAILGDHVHRVEGGGYLNGVVITDTKSNYMGHLYYDDIREGYIWADKGTDPKNANYIQTDVDLGGTRRIRQLDVARDNARQLARNGVPNLVFTGHSLGGALAILQGLTINRPVVTFNSAPFSSSIADAYGVTFGNANRLITNYHVANDPLTLAETGHYVLSGMVGLGHFVPGLGPLADDGAHRLWRIGVPPGNNYYLPAASSISVAHSMGSVLDGMASNQFLMPRVPASLIPK